MKDFDSEQVRRIWQRVQAGSTPQTDITAHTAAPEPGCDFSQLSDRALEISGLYLRLSRYFSGQNSRILRQLAQQARSHAATLQGICRLCDRVRPATPKQQPERSSPEILLRRCYSLALQALAEYERQSEHPQFGAVFAKMAEQKRNHCRILLTLLGSLKPR